MAWPRKEDDNFPLQIFTPRNYVMSSLGDLSTSTAPLSQVKVPSKRCEVSIHSLLKVKECPKSNLFEGPGTSMFVGGGATLHFLAHAFLAEKNADSPGHPSCSWEHCATTRRPRLSAGGIRLSEVRRESFAVQVSAVMCLLYVPRPTRFEMSACNQAPSSSKTGPGCLGYPRGVL